jgi:hypothetical protein
VTAVTDEQQDPPVVEALARDFAWIAYQSDGTSLKPRTWDACRVVARRHVAAIRADLAEQLRETANDPDCPPHYRPGLESAERIVRAGEGEGE